MAPRLATRLDSVKPSPTLAFNAKAKLLAAQGKQVANLTVGEPDFAAPLDVMARANSAVAGGKVKYQPGSGSPALRAAMARYVSQPRGYTYQPNNVIPTHGAKFGLFAAIMATVNPGDTVIIEAPYWMTYADQVRLCGGVPILVSGTEQTGFKVTAQQLSEALLINGGAKVVMLCSPNNPTGAVTTREELSAKVLVLNNYPNTWIVSDEIYGGIVFDGQKATSPIELAPSLADRLIIIDGLSKSHAMTGVRSGLVAGPDELIGAIARIIDATNSGLSTHALEASLAAYEGDYTTLLTQMVATYQRRRDFFINGLNTIPGVSSLVPGGAFYAFMNVQGLLGKTKPDGSVITNTQQLCDWLLEKHYLAMIYGAAFGAEGYVRASLAASDETLNMALEKLNDAAVELTQR